jgi:hypothetical protein
MNKLCISCSFAPFQSIYRCFYSSQSLSLSHSLLHSLHASVPTACDTSIIEFDLLLRVQTRIEAGHPVHRDGSTEREDCDGEAKAALVGCVLEVILIAHNPAIA